MSFENRLKRLRDTFTQIQILRDTIKLKGQKMRELSKENRSMAQELSQKLDEYAELVK